jgi:RNA polymerase sigma-70 factor (ECF subfamily)
MQTTGDKERFLTLIGEHKGIIIKICNSYCRNKADRDDLAQEIIYQLWRSGHSFDPGQRFSTWMYRVALNVAISFYRKSIKESIVGSLSGEEESIADKPADETEDNIHILQQFIYELKELERALMILYLEAKTYREIADILGISETNVATKISRVKEKLKQKFLQKIN